MSLKKLIDLDGLSRFKSKILAQIPTKMSDLTNDSGYITEWEDELPEVTASDNGKMLMVINGVWSAGTLPVYNGEHHTVTNSE